MPNHILHHTSHTRPYAWPSHRHHDGLPLAAAGTAADIAVVAVAVAVVADTAVVAVAVVAAVVAPVVAALAVAALVQRFAAAVWRGSTPVAEVGYLGQPGLRSQHLGFPARDRFDPGLPEVALPSAP